MANTIRASKNTFNGGLVMDLAPDTTPNEVLTSALNATLVTFNGNELLLQNDMGNGRVETARLPEGYIPVGTCEFGDIIYIVSYNPLTNRSQIGCFPSPERNISSEEIGSAGQSLSTEDFQEMATTNYNYKPTGELKASSVKKIIYNNKMNPGDKYIIYDKNNRILEEKHISDIGNTSHIYGTFPKLLKIHVVAIEDSGKINYLDSTIKWYSKKLNSTKVDYFMMANKVNSGSSTDAPDIDSYRDLLSSGYSVFQSKISGKLALLIELEKINGFSCTYNTYTSQQPLQKDVAIGNNLTIPVMIKNCRIYWNINWNTDDNNVNPKYIVLTKSEWKSRQPGDGTSNKAGYYYLWRVLNNTAQANIKVSLINAIRSAFPNDGYYSEEISRLYDMSADNISYITFIKSKSYDKKLEAVFDKPDEPKGIRTATNSPYAGKELYKLNLSRKDITIDNYRFIGLPREDTTNHKSYYFINLSSIERNNDVQPNGLPDAGATLYTGYISDSTKDEGKIAVTDYTLSDDIVNNYFHTSVTKFFHDFNIPVELVIDGNSYIPDTSNLIYHYEITPAMDYGLLREYSIEGYIDFSKIGTGAIDLTHWKYYNTENISTLTVGLDAYVEENKGIAEVALEFYDNQGYVATYHILDRESYSGVFTEIIPLNGSTQSINLNAEPDAQGNLRYHLGPDATDFAENVGYCPTGTTEFSPLYYKQELGKVKAYIDNNYETLYTSDHGRLVINDIGTIYANAIYLVKIIVKYCQKDALGKLDTSLDSEFKTYYRWYWTNTIFNNDYSNVNDFDILQPSLTIDTNVKYEMDDLGYKEPEKDLPPNEPTVYSDLQKSAGVTIQRMKNQKIKVLASPYLYNNYNTFMLLGNKNEANSVNGGVYYGLKLKVCKGKRYIELYLSNGSKEPPIQIHTGDYSPSIYTEWEGMKFVPGDTETNDSMIEYHDNWRDEAQGGGGYETLTDDFRVDFDPNLNLSTADDGYYINKNSEYISKTGYPETTYTCKAIDDGIEAFNLNLQHYSKYYTICNMQNRETTALIPLIQTKDDLEKYNLALDTNLNPYIKTHIALSISGLGYRGSWLNYLIKHKYKNGSAEFNLKTNQDYVLVVDVWNINNSGDWIYKGTFSDTWEDWYEGTYVPLSLFDHGSSRKFWHRLNGGTDAENGISDIWFDGRNTNLTDGPNCLMRSGFFSYNLYAGLQGTALDGFIGYSNNQGIANGECYSGDLKISLNMYGVGYVDKNHDLHLFNTKYSGRKLLSALTQIYIMEDRAILPVRTTTDIVYLLDNYTLYTQDIVYEYYSNNNLTDNQLITIYDHNYIKHIGEILKKIGILSESEYINNGIFKDVTGDRNISMNNVNMTLKYSSRNVPLEFKMNYKRPDTFIALELEESKVLLKTIDGGGDTVLTEDPINNTTLYQYVQREEVVKELDAGLVIKNINITDAPAGTLLVTIDENNYYTASRFYQVFKYDGDQLEFVTKEFSPSDDYWSIGLCYYNDTGTIQDLLKKDILIDSESLINY